jgi:hypothetical protein
VSAIFQRQVNLFQKKLARMNINSALFVTTLPGPIGSGTAFSINAANREFCGPGHSLFTTLPRRVASMFLSHRRTRTSPSASLCSTIQNDPNSQNAKRQHKNQFLEELFRIHRRTVGNLLNRLQNHSQRLIPQCGLNLSKGSGRVAC